VPYISIINVNAVVVVVVVVVVVYLFRPSHHTLPSFTSCSVVLFFTVFHIVVSWILLQVVVAVLIGAHSDTVSPFPLQRPNSGPLLMQTT